MSFAAFSSGGAALLTKTFLAQVGATRFVKKMANLKKLEEIQDIL